MIQEFQSWTEQWENMSDVSLNDSYDNPGNTLQGIPGEMSQLLFGAPPNTRWKVIQIVRSRTAQ